MSPSLPIFDRLVKLGHIISFARTIVQYYRGLQFRHSKCHGMIKPGLILSTDCGALIIDHIHLVIPATPRFPDVIVVQVDDIFKNCGRAEMLTGGPE
jgi:hypothetical protein